MARRLAAGHQADPQEAIEEGLRALVRIATALGHDPENYLLTSADAIRAMLAHGAELHEEVIDHHFALARDTVLRELGGSHGPGRDLPRDIRIGPNKPRQR